MESFDNNNTNRDLAASNTCSFALPVAHVKDHQQGIPISETSKMVYNVKSNDDYGAPSGDKQNMNEPLEESLAAAHGAGSASSFTAASKIIYSSGKQPLGESDEIDCFFSLEGKVANKEFKLDDFQATQARIAFCGEFPSSSVNYDTFMELARLRQWDKLLELGDQYLYSELKCDPKERSHGYLLRQLLSNPHHKVEMYDREILHELSVLLYLRWTGMAKLRRIEHLRAEMRRLNINKTLDQGDCDVEDAFHTWMPLGLQIASILSLQYTVDPSTCSDILHRYIDNLRRRYAVSGPQVSASYSSPVISIELWIMRAQASIANLFVKQKHWRLALMTMDQMLLSIRKIIIIHDNSDEDDLVRLGTTIEILSRQGRILLQIGAIDEAQELFRALESQEYLLLTKKIQLRRESYTLSTSINEIARSGYINVLVNKGLLFFSREQFSRAMEQFSAAVEECRAMLLEREMHHKDYFSKDRSGEINAQISWTKELYHLSIIGVPRSNMLSDWLSTAFVAVMFDPPAENASHLTSCINNMALCALYSCQMRKAVHILESLVRENPALYLTEALTFNLCTLYELGSDNTTSSKKKRVLQLVSTRFGLADIPEECFRVV